MSFIKNCVAIHTSWYSPDLANENMETNTVKPLIQCENMLIQPITTV